MPPAWALALALAASMWASFALGWRLGRRWPSQGQAPPASRLDRAILGILGLLLAFTFSLAMSQYNERRQLAVGDANAIGSFYNCASLLDEPLRGRLRDLVRRYLERRVDLGHARDTGAALARELPVIRQMHLEMRELVREAVEERSPVANPLVSSLNEVMSSHASRMAAVKHRLPWSILSLLGTTAIGSILIVGAQQGALGDRNLVTIAVFVVLTCLVVWVTLDMNDPGTRAITANQEPLERLLRTIAR
jgi:hypothetical protein